LTHKSLLSVYLLDDWAAATGAAKDVRRTRPVRDRLLFDYSGLFLAQSQGRVHARGAQGRTDGGQGGDRQETGERQRG